MLAVTGAEGEPPVSVAIKVTVYVATSEYVWVAVAVGALVVTGGEPSPKLNV